MQFLNFFRVYLIQINTMPQSEQIYRGLMDHIHVSPPILGTVNHKITIHRNESDLSIRIPLWHSIDNDNVGSLYSRTGCRPFIQRHVPQNGQHLDASRFLEIRYGLDKYH